MRAWVGWRAAGTAGVLLVTLAGCGRVDTGPGGCRPEGLVWVYSQVVDREDHGYPTKVFRLQDGDETALTGDDAASEPSVSPAGDRVVFRRGSEGDPESAGYSRYRLYTMDSDGGDERPLLEPAYEIGAGTGGTAWDTAPAWSPDGSRVAFVRYHNPDPGDLPGARQVMVVSATGGAPTALPGTGTDLHDPPPAWSADGTRLAWSTPSTGLLHWSDVDGTNHGEARLPGQGGTPAWSRDGEAVLVPVAADWGDPPVLHRVALPAGDVTTLEVSMSGIWRLPTGELAGVEPDGASGQIVVIDLDAGDTTGRDRREIGILDQEVDARLAPVTAVPDRAGGWASCT